MATAPVSLVANALGAGTESETNLIGKVLQLLGIGFSSDEDNETATTLGLSVTGHNDSSSYEAIATFDFKGGRWHLGASTPALAGVRDYTSNVDDARVNKLEGWSHADDDWTATLPQTAHVDFIKSRDWAASDLGPISSWSPQLRMAVRNMLINPRPANIYWSAQESHDILKRLADMSRGTNWTAIYNESFVPLAASRHPFLMSARCEDALPATWPHLSQVFEEVKTSGIPFSLSDFELEVEKTKEGFIEESWYDGAFVPLLDEDGRFLGLHNPGNEITDHKISTRRTRLLHRIAAADSDSKTLSPWRHIIEASKESDRDITLLMVYSANDADTKQSHECKITLEGTLGIEKGHTAAPKTTDMYTDNTGFLPALRAAKAKGSPMLLDMPDGRLPDFLSTGIDWRGFGQPATHIAILPLFPTSLIGGFMIVGLNPRSLYDESHIQFVHDLGRAATGLVLSTFTMKQAQEREAKLNENITEQEKFIRHIAEIASVGIYSSNVNGVITWANSKFYNMFGASDKPEDNYAYSIIQHLLEEDRLRAISSFRQCIDDRICQNQEFQMKLTWTPPYSETTEPCWMLVANTLVIEDDQVRSVIGCVTDISHLKWAEKLQAESAEAAKEAKQKQEMFLDMTSHELRNPLSSILQCADDITLTAQRYGELHRDDSDLHTTFDSMLDNARTVLFCAAHQKRILDDVLTVSKLDSAMLNVTPVLVDPSIVAAQTLQMFEAELYANKFTFDFKERPSYVAENINSVFCDPSRLTQVLINLITNAIKFTKTCDKRNIHVRLGASGSFPPSDVKGVHWMPSGLQRQSLTAATTPDLEGMDPLYLSFEVEDSGSGISDVELLRLFNRFTQASKKTHVKYGGSGLGLFISRELTELQGGMIGAKSSPGKGSTFAFYIRTRKALTADLPAPATASLTNGQHSLSRREDAPPIQKVVTNHAIKKGVVSVAYTVLLVEDNLINQEVLRKQLQRSGCTVYVANHGLEALHFIETTSSWTANHGVGVKVDVVLMDWEMPVMDGITCTTEIRKLEAAGQITDQIPIIATTANARPHQVKMLSEAGVDQYIAKPFTISQLLTQVSGLVGPDTAREGNVHGG